MEGPPPPEHKVGDAKLDGLGDVHAGEGAEPAGCGARLLEVEAASVEDFLKLRAGRRRERAARPRPGAPRRTDTPGPARTPTR